MKNSSKFGEGGEKNDDKVLIFSNFLFFYKIGFEKKFEFA